MNEKNETILLSSASQLAQRIRTKQISSQEVVECHIEQIQKVNPFINAVVKTRFEEARQEAQAADEQIQSGNIEALPPFHGVPCSIKEAFALTGMPNCSGLVARKNFVATHDATAVTRLRQAGAIPLGVTNISELCMWFESNNRVYGRTCNPYDLKRIAGGSSGGEGAIVGAGASPFGLGSDIGGSIRMPAFFNGVFGHKPSGGLVPGTGQFPNGSGVAQRYITTGPLARRAEDLMPLLRILAGPDGQDSGCVGLELGNVEQVDISTLTIFDVEGDGTITVSQDLQDAQQKVVTALERRGAHVKKITINGFRQSMHIWSSMLKSAGGPTFKNLLGQGSDINPWRHLGLMLLGGSPHTLPAIGLAFLEYIDVMFPERIKRFVQVGLELKQELNDLLGPQGIMLYPSYPTPAPRHRFPIFTPHYPVYTAIFNVMELPVTQVPLGLNQAGLPLGVQVVAKHGNDHLTIAVAQLLEAEFGGWVPPALANLPTVTTPPE